MPRLPLIVVCCLLGLGVPNAFGQFGDLPINTFGYFQISAQHQTEINGDDDANDFSLQQLNLIFESNLSRQWRAFVDFEFLNNFSSSRRWGSFDINEAWISYRASRRLTLKAGLHVPVFNHLNDIKNRTPLLPYVIRPLVYEESFREILNIEEYVPERAYAQVKGFLSLKQAKVDYAAYVGNSPNIRSQFDTALDGSDGQTGVDTTETVLVGGRLGLRYKALTLGGSFTREHVDFFRGLEDPFGLARQTLTSVPKTRLGADLSLYLGRISFEGEVIAVRYDVDEPRELPPFPGQRRARMDLNRLFYYGTLGYNINDRLFAYASYWFSDEGFTLQASETNLKDELDIEVPTTGLRYTLVRDDSGFDRITLKTQYAYVRIRSEARGVDQFRESVDFKDKPRLHLFGLALSVLF